MPDTPSVTTIKRFPYRGQEEEWSNTYHFAGSAPGDEAGWKTLADELIAEESKVLPFAHKFVRAYGYNAGNESSVAQIDYVALGAALVAGSLGNSAEYKQSPGDAAVMLRARVGLNVKGKKVYIRKYFHGAVSLTADPPDNVYPPQIAALTALGTLLVGTTILPGGWCAPQGAVGTAPLGLPFITTRTLKRRGKRPSS